MVSRSKVRSSVGCVYVSQPDGHRAAYVEQICEETGLSPLIAPRTAQTISRLLAEPFVFFATLEDDVLAFIVVAQLRRMMGRSTAAIMLSPQYCTKPSKLNHYIRRKAFSSFTKGKAVSILSILPHYLDKEFALYSRGWIYDPQFWDLARQITSGAIWPKTELADRCISFADGRPILLYLGVATRIKGFHFLSDILNQHPELSKSIAVVVAGSIPEGMTEACERLRKAGAMIEPRYLSEDEVLSLKLAATCFWACYDPSYDQSSGLFGRALQLNKSVVVRSDSWLETLAQHLGANMLSCKYADIAEGSAILKRISVAKTEPSEPHR